MKKIILSISTIFVGLTLTFAQQVTLKGSDALYPALNQISKDYSSEPENKEAAGKLKDVLVKVTGQGSVIGIQDLQKGLVDVASSSRKLTSDEKQGFQSAGIEVKEVAIAKEAIVIIVNPSNPVQKLSKQQIADIFSGKIKNWNEIFSKADLDVLLKTKMSSAKKDIYKKWAVNVPIKTFIRANTTGCYFGFKNQFLENSNYGESAMMMSTNLALMNEVKKDVGSASFLGFMDLANNPEIKSVAAGSDTSTAVSPTKENIHMMKYEYMRDCYLIYDVKNVSKVKSFVDYVLNDKKGQQTLWKMGFIPLSHFAE